MKLEFNEKEYTITLEKGEKICTAFEESGMMGTIIELSQLDKEKIAEGLPQIFGGFKSFFGLVKVFFEIATDGEVDPMTMDIEDAVLITMISLNKIVGPLRYVLSPDHLETLKKNIFGESDGEPAAGESEKPPDPGTVSSEPSETN